MSTTRKNNLSGPLPRCPHFNAIHVVQFQLFDNGTKPGRGKSQHVMGVEVYCDGRLNFMKPYWKRAVSLITPKLFFAWVEREHAAGNIDDGTFAHYRTMYECSLELDEELVEFVKFGHIGSSEAGTTYYVGQYIFVIKYKGGGLDVVMSVDGGEIMTDSFLYDKNWRPGGKRRKFFGFYDPCNMYEAAQREKAFAAQAEMRSAARSGASE